MFLSTFDKKVLFSSIDIEKLERVGFWLKGDPSISGITEDSRKARNNFIFFALPGTRVHGANFVQLAIEKGVCLVITDEIGRTIIDKAGLNAPIVLSSEPRLLLTKYASRCFADQPENLVAVTGTNGKTSVCDFTRQIWELMGFSAVNLGTMGVQGAITAKTNHTTPDPITLHKFLSHFSRNKISHVALEASSHGLEQYRMDGVELKAAAFTNLSRDHLDYHKNMDDYLVAKCGLFDRVLPIGRTVVLNADDKYSNVIRLIANGRGQKIMTVGNNSDADLNLINRRFNSTGQTIRFSYLGNTQNIDISLIGGFQALNVLMATALAIVLGADSKEVFKVLPKLKTVHGRMELVASKKCGAQIFVDYAHTPDALKNALCAIRPHVLGSLFVVFGAGGDRDPGKRTIMGKIAEKHADKVIVTDDNPRTENPRYIRSQILKGCRGAIEIGDRAQAILYSIDALTGGDVLLIAGKGHETGQIIGNDTFPFDDGEQASISVSLLEGVKA